MDSNNTTIKFLKLKPTDGKYFNLYVANELLSCPELPCISLPLKKKMTEAIYEILSMLRFIARLKISIPAVSFTRKRT